MDNSPNRELGGIPYHIDPLLQPGSVRLIGTGTDTHIETDSEATLQAVIHAANDGRYSRILFEGHIRRTYGPGHTQPWDICERATSGGGGRWGDGPLVTHDGYLDLYTQRRWEGWKLAQ
jgi:hypothetical protein